MSRAAERPLYPATPAANSGVLPVSERHTLYYREYGTPDGAPAVILHGGPGAGAGPSSARFFDPAAYRIVLFDQRGCGRSTPHADLVDNTTWHLVADIERLRRHLGIERWLVFGGSWGATLALVYAETHPARVSALVLRGIFTLRRAEILWFYQHGAHALFPDAYERFRNFIPACEQHDLISAYYRRLTAGDESLQLAAARRWSAWEHAASSAQAAGIDLAATPPDRFVLAFARIECHYFVHRGFLARDDQVLARVDALRHIPARIVHGRFDVITPLVNAWDLHRAWPQAALTVSPHAGHSAFEPENSAALVAATNAFRPG